jgi:cytochrome c biogenesis protein CcmG, thiol:disulfide interchange protein DsbE
MAAVKGERILQGLIAACLAILAWVVIDTFRERVVVAGDTAPQFSISTDAGRTVTRSDFGGKLLVLNFWATWCQPCIEEMPSLDQFQKTFADSGVVVLGVSVDQSAQAYRNVLAKAKVAFQTARDPEGRISAEYGTFKYPETYIIDREGLVVEKIIGPANWTGSGMIARVKKLLSS